MTTEITEDQGVVTHEDKPENTIECELEQVAEELHDIQIRVDRFLLKLDRVTAKVEAEYAKQN